MAKLAVFILVLVGIYARANSQPVAKKAYVLKGSDQPVQIENIENVPADGLVMRDPNIPGQNSVIVESKSKEAAKPKAITKPKTKLGNSKKPIGLKPMKIAASVRLPRVSFGRIDLPVGLREEQPRLDFIERSLSEMP